MRREGPGRTRLSRGALAALLSGAALGLVPGPAAAGADLGERLGAEVRLRAAADAGDRQALEGLLAADLPGSVRGRALWELYRGGRAPLPAPERVRLQEAMGDADPAVRQAALRAMAAAGDRPLEREALKRAAEDQDPEVRVEALRAVRPWSRQGHLYFLEQALGHADDRVRVEAVRSLAAVPYREVAPEIIARVQALAAGKGVAYGVRGEALEALRRWQRLGWELVGDAMGERGAPEFFRLQALALADALPRAESTGPLLLGVLSSDPSLRVAWGAFRRLVQAGGAEAELAPATARLLARVPQHNAATSEMAAFLKARGYRVEYRAGSWNVSGR